MVLGNLNGKEMVDMTNEKNAILEGQNFLTTKEVWEVLDRKISITTINQLIRQGKIPSAQMGRKNLVPTWFIRGKLMKGEFCNGE